LLLLLLLLLLPLLLYPLAKYNFSHFTERAVLARFLFSFGCSFQEKQDAIFSTASFESFEDFYLSQHAILSSIELAPGW
jgi:hypothetical protein